MASRRPNLSPEEIAKLFQGEDANKFPPILSLSELAKLLRVSPKTLDHWKSQGRLDGSFKKIGKRVLILRDKAIKLLFDGRD